MAPLAHALALLAMTMATMANEVKPLDMAKDSFDDQYKGCHLEMTGALPALKCSELQQNSRFARAWEKAVARWQKRGPPVSPLSPDQATAVIAFTMDDLHKEFNEAVSTAGRSPQEYQDNFKFKTLHFLLTDALATLREAQGGKCVELLRRVCEVQFVAQKGDTVRFDRFMSMSRSETADKCSGKETMFRVYTCQGVDVGYFTQDSENWGVLIPPFETFEVIEVTQSGPKSVIQLHSTGTSSNHNCEWLKLTPQGTPSEGGDTRGGTIAMAPFHLGWFLLATTALAVATGIL